MIWNIFQLIWNIFQFFTPLQVVRKWRSLAFRLGLSEYILDIDCWRGGGQASSGFSRRRRGSREKDKMELLMKIWRETKPETYNVGILKTVLSAEVVFLITIVQIITINCYVPLPNKEIFLFWFFPPSLLVLTDALHTCAAMCCCINALAHKHFLGNYLVPNLILMIDQLLMIHHWLIHTI